MTVAKTLRLTLRLMVNGVDHELLLEPRTTLLQALRALCAEPQGRQGSL